MTGMPSRAAALAAAVVGITALAGCSTSSGTAQSPPASASSPAATPTGAASSASAEPAESSAAPSAAAEPRPYVGEGGAYDSMPTAAQVSDIFGFKVKAYDTATTDPSAVGSLDGVQPKRCAPVLSLLFSGTTPDAGELVSKEYASSKYLALPSVSLSELEVPLDDLQDLLDKCDTVKDVYPSGAVFLKLDDQYKKVQVRSTSRPRPDVLLVDAVLSQMSYNPQDPGSCNSNWTDNAGRQMCPLEYTQRGLFALQQVGGTLVDAQSLGITRINGSKRSPKLPTSEQVLALLDVVVSNVQSVSIDE